MTHTTFQELLLTPFNVHKILRFEILSSEKHFCHCKISEILFRVRDLDPCFRDKWQIWDGSRKFCFSPSRIVTFLPVQKSFVPAGPKCDVFREGCDKKRHKLKQTFSYARASHSSQKCDKCDASHFLSPKKVTNVTSLTQIWDGKLGRNPGKTDPYNRMVRERDRRVIQKMLWGNHTQSSSENPKHRFELHRPSSKGTKLLFQVIKAII